MATILIVDDEPTPLQIMEELVRQAGHRPIAVRSVEAALTVLARGGVDLVVSDYRMPGTTGLEFLGILEDEGFKVGLIMVTGYASIEHAVSAIKAGAIDYVTKPVRAAQLELAIDQALEFLRLRAENAQLRKEVGELRSGKEIVGASESLKRVMETIRTVAPARASVLLEGESGTGKELLARALHNLSDRASGPFISINCAALPETLVESALFGHEKGAFTGAVKTVHGAFERAHRGTLLLDEVTEMRQDLQAKLLRVLQEQEFERVGGTSTIRVDVRVVATTNRTLSDEIRAGRFREDLYYRLSVVPIRVPPLRERREDIPALTAHFARRVAMEMGKPLSGVSPEALDLLQNHDWPGNVRELSHAVERAVILCRGEILDAGAFDAARFGLSLPEGSPGVGPGAGDREGQTPPTREHDSASGPDPVMLRTLNLAEAETVLIGRALERTGDNRTQAADLLGINVRTLRSKLNRPD
ncbi:MAG: sigma-54-dependent Fis family transcriptional regulator [Gemmatimonadales bacterium]|nr:MAG: sigma-54-dependent Fis family transcriptional regulator [Gemmatimonadales bacterium]